MNCDICGEPIRPAEERDHIDRHDGRYEYEYVHDNGPEISGNPICPVTCVATPRRHTMTEARPADADELATVLEQIADYSSDSDIRAHVRQVVSALRGDGLIILNGPPQERLRSGEDD